tara:strand:+ start:908 stop:2047 length:1140 start_codon:yes stop_codon:yes gene_type:complete
MSNLEIQKFHRLPVTILSSFGHNGLDWLHSLLDGHSQIVLMPAYSFYRTLDFYKKLRGHSLLELNKSATLASNLSKFIWEDPSYKVVRRRFLNDHQETEIFQKHLTNYIDQCEEDNLEKALFFGVNYAFCKLHNRPLDSIKMIISQEHVSWHSEKYKNIFDSNFVLMMRDPRAGLAGSWKRQVENAGYKSVNPYDFDKGILVGTYLERFCKKHSDFAERKVRVMVNEEMHDDLRGQMTNLCKWLNLDYEESCLEETFLGKEWLGESSYLAVDELSERPPDDFYTKENIEKRWRGQIDNNSINMIEYLFKKSISDYGYNRDNSENIISSLKALRKYLFTMLVNPKEQDRFLVPIKSLRNFFRRFFVLFFPLSTPKIFTIL